jgi:PAS domain S-box-containing protein
MLRDEVVQSSVEGIYAEEKRAEEKLEELKEFGEKFQVLINFMPDPIIIVNGKGKFLAVNDRMEEKTGFKREELLGKNFLRAKILTEKSRAILIKNLAKKIVGMHAAPYEVEVLTKDGKKLVTEINVAMVEYEGKPANLVIFRDITERKKVEDVLRQSEEKYRSLVKNIPDVVWTTSQDGITVFLSSNVEKMYGYTSEEILETGLSHWFVRVYPDDVEYVKEAHERLFTENKKYDVTYRIRRKDGKWIWIHDRSVVTYKKDGVMYADGLISDVTEQIHMKKKLEEYSERLEELVERRTRALKKAQKQLLEAQRLAAIGEVAAMVGHDLRNPLQSIKNATYYLNNELSCLPHSVPIPQKAIEMLHIISDSVNYADMIMRDLQDFSATKTPILKKTDIKAIVKEALSQVKVPENVELITELGCLSEIMADNDQIKRVFINLAANAIQAMENGGTLTVSAKKTKGFVEVSFKDTGVGISKENMEKIFTPFFTTKAKGMGMGLPICKKFIESHGGNIEAKSKVGKGTTFTVKLPIQQENRGRKQ